MMRNYSVYKFDIHGEDEFVSAMIINILYLRGLSGLFGLCIFGQEVHDRCARCGGYEVFAVSGRSPVAIKL